jgi:hypothetical protein
VLEGSAPHYNKYCVEVAKIKGVGEGRGSAREGGAPYCNRYCVDAKGY